MAENTIFLTYTDFLQLSTFIIDTYDATFVAENTFDNPANEKFNSVPDIEAHLKKYENSKLKSDTFFITSNKWSIEPIYFKYLPNPKNFPPYYYAHQQYGGPSIHFIPTYNNIRNPIKDKIVRGNLSDYSYYISGSFLKDRENGYQTIDRPQSMKLALTEIKKFIRKNGHKVAYRDGKFVKIGYAMTDAFSYYKNGVKLVEGDLEFQAG